MARGWFQTRLVPTMTNTFARALAAIAIAGSITITAGAQWEPYKSKNVPRTPDGKVDLKAPPRRTADGKIDLSGFWMPTNPVKHLLNLAADLKPGDVPLQPWAAALYQERIENNGKDHPGVRCWPSGIPEKNNIPDGLKLVQTPDLMIFLHESRTIYRQVFTDGRPLPKDAQPAWMGYSVGRWEGDTFVVETIGQNGKTWLDMRGLPATEALKVTERYTRPDDRTDPHRRHHRRPQGLHQAVERAALVDPAARHRADREHLRREQQGRSPHGGQVAAHSTRTIWIRRVLRRR